MKASDAKDLALKSVDKELKLIYKLIEDEAKKGNLNVSLDEKPSDSVIIFLRDAGYEVKITVGFGDDKDGKWNVRWSK